MKSELLRNILILIGFIVVPSTCLGTAMVAFGPYTDVPGSLANYGAFPYFQFLISALGLPAIAALCFWAAQNLKPLSFMSSKSLQGFLLLSVWLNLFSIVLSIVSIQVETALFGSNNGTLIPASGYALSTFFYGVSSILLLIFARKQLASKEAGETLKEAPISETFS